MADAIRPKSRLASKKLYKTLKTYKRITPALALLSTKLRATSKVRHILLLKQM